MSTGANDEAILTWNTVLFDKFTRFRHVIRSGFTVYGSAVLERFPPEKGARVLDVGCAFGDSTFDIASRVGPSGEAVGVDCADHFIESARKTAAESGVKNARFVTADVESAPLGGPYDLAFAQFGTMFFANPVAAMKNVRGALVSGGRLAMVVWRRREDNAWADGVKNAIDALIPPPADPDGITCGPGPFSMAGADTTSEVLKRAGFGNITFERFDQPLLVGRDLDEAIEFALALGPAGEAIRLAGDEGQRRLPEARQILREFFAPWVGAGGEVRVPASTWIIAARA